MCAATVALAAVGISAMLAAHRSADPVLGNWSLPAAMALVVTSIVASAAIGLAVLPATHLARIEMRLDAVRAKLRHPAPRGRATVGLTLCAASAGAAVWLTLHAATDNRLASDDQAEYLRTALTIHQAGGVATLWTDLWTGRFLEANRHPLYLSLLSIHPTFAFGKALSALAALLTIGVIASGVQRRQGWHAAGLAAVFAATSLNLVRAAGSVACESLLVLCTATAWSALPFATGAAREQSTRQIVVQLACAGACLGAAYLTKATGFILLVGLVGCCATDARLRAWCWVAAVAFAAVASPLLTRNMLAYGNPLYSFNTRFLFEDRFEDGLARPTENTGTAARRYFRDHGLTQMIGRAANGVGWEAYVALRSWSPANWSRGAAWAGSLIAAATVLGCMVAARSAVRLFLIWLVSFVVVFGWYVPIASGDRFVLPLLPCVVEFAAIGICRSVGGGERWAARWAIGLGLAWIVCALALGLSQPVGGFSRAERTGAVPDGMPHC